MATNSQRRLFGVAAIAAQALLFVFFVLFTTYSDDFGSGSLVSQSCANLVDASSCNNATGCTFDNANFVCIGEDGACR